MQKYKFKLFLLIVLSTLFLILLSIPAIINNSNKEEATEEPTVAHAATCPYHETPLTSSTTNLRQEGSYYLTGDLEISSTLTINATWKTVNLCLNGYMLKMTANKAVITVQDTTGLNLYDCGNDENHKHYYTKNDNGVYVFGSGTDYLTGGVITGGKTGGGAGVNMSRANQTFNMYGGSIAGNSATMGGAICCTTQPTSTVNMYGGKICGNYAQSGGGIYLNGGNFNISGGEIYDNHCSDQYKSAGIEVTSGTVTLSGDVKIYDNTNANGIVCNVYTYQKITLDSAGFLPGATVGITVNSYTQNYDAGTFFTNNSNQTTADLLSDYFFDDANAHKHNYGNLIPRVEPTCSSTGLEAHYQCSICSKYFDTSQNKVDYANLEIPTTPHTLVIDAGYPATCSTVGKTDGEHCSVCNTVTVSQVTILMTPHTPVIDNGYPATCSTTGLTDGEHCSVCGTVTVTQTPISTLPHTPVIDTGYPATCSSTGLTDGEHCSVCNTITVTQTTLAMLPHTPVTDPAVAETCTTAGKTAGMHCSVCNAVITAQSTIPASGHNYVAGAVTPPTATDAGYTTFTCTKCGHSYRDNYVPAAGHSYQPANVVQPTCTDMGYTTYVCTDCGNSYDADYTAALGHDYQPTVTAPDCTNNGFTTHTCSRCSDSYTDTITFATGHNYSLVCTWVGDNLDTVNLVCQVCGDSISIPTTNATVTDGVDANGDPTKTVTVTEGGTTYTETFPAPNGGNNPNNPNNPNGSGNNNPNNPNGSGNNNPNGSGNNPNGSGNNNNPNGSGGTGDNNDPNGSASIDDPNGTGGEGSGCNANLNWLFYVVIGVVLFDIILFICMMAVIRYRKERALILAAKEDNDDDNDFDDFTDGGMINIYGDPFSE